MSQENVEIVREILLRWHEAISAGPQQALAAIPNLFDADIDYYPVRKWPEAQPCHGREEFSQFMVRLLDAFTHIEWTIRELTAVGDDRVLARENMSSQGRGSGIKLEGDVYRCYWVRHGRIFRVEDHFTLNAALHAVGLSEQAQATDRRA